MTERSRYANKNTSPTRHDIGKSTTDGTHASVLLRRVARIKTSGQHRDDVQGFLAETLPAGETECEGSDGNLRFP